MGKFTKQNKDLGFEGARLNGGPVLSAPVGLEERAVDIHGYLTLTRVRGPFLPFPPLR